MIPMIAQDYIRYQQALKGNRLKGADLFRSLLEDKGVSTAFDKTPAAAGAVFSGCSLSYNRLLPGILAEPEYSEHLENMVAAYANGGMGTSHATLEQAAQDSRFSKAFHAHDISELPFTMQPGYTGLLRIPGVALGYSSGDEKHAIGSRDDLIRSLGISSQSISFTEYYTWAWAAAYVPNRGWYVFGAFTNSSGTARTACVWQVIGSTPTRRYTAPEQQEYIAACYHPGQERIYAFRNANTSTSTGSDKKNRTPAASLYLDVFSIGADGTLSRTSTSTIGTNVNVNEMLYDPSRNKLVCVGQANASFTFNNQSYTHPRNYAVPVIMIGDTGGWTVKLHYNFSRSPNSYDTRRMSLDRSTGKILITMGYNTAFILRPNNTIQETVFNSGSSNYPIGNVNICVGRNRWIVNYHESESASSLCPYVLEVNEDGTLKEFKRLSSYTFGTMFYDPVTRYVGLYASGSYAYDHKANNLRVLGSTHTTFERFVYTATDVAQTLALSAGTEVNDYQTPGAQGKLTLAKATYWEV